MARVQDLDTADAILYGDATLGCVRESDDPHEKPYRALRISPGRAQHCFLARKGRPPRFPRTQRGWRVHDYDHRVPQTVLRSLGLGQRPPAVSWGVLLQRAQNFRSVAAYPWILIPAIFVIVVVLAFNFVGDGLRDAADPYKI